MAKKLSDEQEERYRQAEQREREEDEGILSLVTNALASWLMKILRLPTKLHR